MKISQRLTTLIRAADRFWKKTPVPTDEYPQSIVDLVIFHKLHFHMSPEQAWKCFSQLKSEFVDWNEVRVSVVREIQEQLAGAHDSLELAVFVKDFLEFVHKERRRITLEPLIEENLTDFRRFFKPVRGLDTATVEFVLMRTKGHPIVPLSAEMERRLSDIGVVKSADSRDRKAKLLYEAIGTDKALSLHHYLLFHTHAQVRDGAGRMPAPLAKAGRSAKKTGRSAKKTTKAAESTKAAPSKATATRKGRAAKSSSTRKIVRKPVASKRVRRDNAPRLAAKKSTSKKKRS